ncbi:MAG TPA: hypothetical protein VK445_10110 [Dissulfurispiraceae bacterium]|nr:hypothetical protein [Dissulfurispiraceae bacterium]
MKAVPFLPSGLRASHLPPRLSRLIVLGAFIFLGVVSAPVLADEKAGKWEGVDKAVVEQVAKTHGREATEPLINAEQGDLMLFLFLSAGTVGGFIAGYSYRTLTERRAGAGEKAT